jgi:hypothetical protein
MKFWISILCSLLLAGVPAIARSLTVDEILLLKENGVSEKTIQMMLESEDRAAANEAASKQGGVRTIVRPNGHQAIIYSTGEEDQDAYDFDERRKEEKAWEMLRHLIIDTRHSIKKETDND